MKNVKKAGLWIRSLVSGQKQKLRDRLCVNENKKESFVFKAIGNELKMCVSEKERGFTAIKYIS